MPVGRAVEVAGRERPDPTQAGMGLVAIVPCLRTDFAGCNRSLHPGRGWNECGNVGVSNSGNHRNSHQPLDLLI